MKSGDATRVVVFGLDGVGLHTLRSTATPHLDSIAAAGFLVPVVLGDGSPTISGPSWATVASGVHPAKHLVFDNDLAGNALARYPDFLSRARSAARSTYAAAAWITLHATTYGGPIFSGQDFFVPDDPPDDPIWDRRDDAIADNAATVLGSADIDVAFVYFGAPDVVGHSVGTGSEYVASIERADARVGRVLTAIRSRKNYPDERWAIVAATDHGHADGGGHGGDSAEERAAWIATDVPGEREDLTLADIHPQVLSWLGIPIDLQWNLDGRPFAR